MKHCNYIITSLVTSLSLLNRSQIHTYIRQFISLFVYFTAHPSDILNYMIRPLMSKSVISHNCLNFLGYKHPNFYSIDKNAFLFGTKKQQQSNVKSN